ncbi:unnamed protein product, partial [Leptidea sinapis]
MATFENRLNRRKGILAGESYRLDTKNKTPEESILEIIHGLYLKKQYNNDISPNHKNVHTELRTGLRSMQRNGSDSLRVSYLTALVHLCKEYRNNLGFTTDELMTLSIDLMLRNEEERAQALRVVRRVIAVVGGTEPPVRRYRAAYIEPGLLRCLASVARAGSAVDGAGDRLSRPAIATLAEI